MAPTTSPIVGRDDERAALDELVRVLGQGRSCALVLSGEAGIGKTALLDYLVTNATDCQVVTVTGVESEMELAYAALHRMCAPLITHLDQLPLPQRQALEVAFGLRAGDPPDRFFVGLATLSLMAEAAQSTPLVCVVDDAQWVDAVSLQTLEFVARRLEAEAVALVFSTRWRTPGEGFAGLPTIEVTGLSPTESLSLLDTVVGAPLDQRVRERVVAETHGNPLAILELPRDASSGELSFGRPAGMDQSVPNRVEARFMQRLASLPSGTRSLLLLAALEPTTDMTLVWRAAAALGDVPDPEPARRAGLVEGPHGSRFRHPLVRSAVLKAATRDELLVAHDALAAATDREVDPDRYAWHLAEACTGPDEAVAAELERSAERAQRRGGAAAAGALLRRAVSLSVDPAARGRRALGAAESDFAAASPAGAADLLTFAEISPISDSERARLLRLQARMKFARQRSNEAVPLLLDAAEQLRGLDPSKARETYLEAVGAALFAGPLDGPGGARVAARAARAATEFMEPPTRPGDLLLDGAVAVILDGHAAGIPVVRKALDPFAGQELQTRAATMDWLLLAPVVQEFFAHQVWDFDAWRRIASRSVRLARDAGALSVLPVALMYEAGVHLHLGDLATVRAMLDEGSSITAATGNAPVSYASLALAGWEGREPDALERIASASAEAHSRGETLDGLAGYTEAVLYNGLGRYDDALTGARRATDADGFTFFLGWSQVERIEAACRLGLIDEARTARELLDEHTAGTDTHWARGVRARSDALMADGAAADELYRAAIDHLELSGVTIHLARAQLLYGEWLRSSGVLDRAVEHLSLAHRAFEEGGLVAFADRARRELKAAGQPVRVARTGPAPTTLTPQELQIAGLATAGRTNREIGAELYISPHTVDWHLRNVFAKLGVSSRRQIGAALQPDP